MAVMRFKDMQGRAAAKLKQPPVGLGPVVPPPTDEWSIIDGPTKPLKAAPDVINDDPPEMPPRPQHRTRERHR